MLRRRKVALWIFGTLAALVAALAWCESQGWPFLRGPLERALSQGLSRRVEIGNRFSLHLLGAIRLNTNALAIGSPQAAPDLLQATNVSLVLPYATVFEMLGPGTHEAPRISTLDVDRLDAFLTRDAQGQANWHFNAPKKSPSTLTMDMPSFGRLVVKGGRIQMQDEVLKLQVDAQVSTAEGDQAQGASGLLIEGKGRYIKRPFELRISSSGVLPLATSPGATVAVPISVRAQAGRTRLLFTGQSHDVLSLAALDGTLDVSGPSLAAVGDAVGVTLPTTAAFTLKGRLGKAGEIWTLKQSDLRVGTSQLGGNFTFDRRPAVPLLTGELTGQRFVLRDLAPAFGAPAPGASINPPPPDGRAVPQRTFDIPSLHAMNASLKIKLQRVELGAIFARPLEPLEGDLSLRDGVLGISHLLASTADGQVSGHVGLNANPKTPLWDADVHWKGIRLEQWLSPRNQFAKEDQAESKGTEHRYVTGQLGGHAQLHGQGNSAAQMLATMDGEAQAWVQDGKVSHLMVEAVGLDIAQALGLIVVGDNLLPMRCAAVRLKAQQGLLTPEVAVIDTTDSTLLASGSVSMVDEKLDLLMTAKPKDISPMTLRTPVKIEGTFAQPKVSLQAKPLGLKVISAVALGFVNPLAALIPLIDVGNPGDGGCQVALAQLKGDRPKADRSR
jgi:uncharacterized protein involved in outer membrane biogenesis